MFIGWQSGEKQNNDIGVLQCIMDKDKNLLVPDENIKDRWREHFDELNNRE